MTTKQRIWLERDGRELKKVDPCHLESREKMAEVLEGIYAELMGDEKRFYERGYDVLMGGLLTATTDGVFSDSELRAILGRNIQFVRAFDYTFEGRLRDPDDWPYEKLSFFMEFLLFMAELYDPRSNLLSVERKRYDIYHAAYTHYKSSPVQRVSAVAWRRFLTESKEFQEQCDVLRRDCLQPRFWAYAQGMRVGEPYDWMVVFDENKNWVIRRPPSVRNECWQVLHDFCFTHRVEMIGTYLIPNSEEYGLHFLPQRIHVNRSDFGVKVFIPDFYTHGQIRDVLDSDLADMKLMLGRHEGIRNNGGWSSKRAWRCLGKVIMRAFRLEGYDTAHRQAYTHELLKQRWANSERVTGASGLVYLPAKEMLPKKKLIEIVDRCVQTKGFKPKQKKLWAEFCRQVIAEGEIQFSPYC